MTKTHLPNILHCMQRVHLHTFMSKAERLSDSTIDKNK